MSKVQKLENHRSALVKGLAKTADFIREFLSTEEEFFNEKQHEMSAVLKKSHAENPWFTIENQRFALKDWAENLTVENLISWISRYSFAKNSKNVALILAGNIPLVGFHDVLCVILAGHIPVVKLSSKDRLLIPFLLKIWQEFSDYKFQYNFVERLQNFDAVIATGSNNTAQYLEQYFRGKPSIIRKNRTSAAILRGDETDAELQLLATDIFMYFGLGCRNVTRLFLPESFDLDGLFRNFLNYKNIINHHSYANNYDYNKAIFLLNQDLFWDNNFVMLREDGRLFSALSVVNFTRYKDIAEVENYLADHQDEIQCIVGSGNFKFPTVGFGQTQHPTLDTYADNVDTVAFLNAL